MKTKEQAEADISEAIVRMEITHIGERPQKVRTYIVEDMVVIRIKCLLTSIEKELIKNTEGVELVKRCRICLIERLRETLKQFLYDILNVKIISFCRDVNVRMEDMFIVLGLSENIERNFQKRKKIN